jgi:hypothetical protein
MGCAGAVGARIFGVVIRFDAAEAILDPIPFTAFTLKV